MPNPSDPNASDGVLTSPIAQQTPLQNQTIDELNDGAKTLQSIIKTTSDLATYRAANDEYAAIQDRISTLLNLKLAADTAEMQVLAPAVQQAKADLDAVLKNVSKASDLINGAAKFLGAVDGLITAAKIAAALV
jgi:hypothetical protein